MQPSDSATAPAIRHFETRTRQGLVELAPGFVCYGVVFFLADKATGEQVPEEEIEAAFRDCSATGINVRLRRDAGAPEGYPSGGVIQEADGQTVTVAGKRMSRLNFHQFYELGD